MEKSILEEYIDFNWYVMKLITKPFSSYALGAPMVSTHEMSGDPWYAFFGSPTDRDFTWINEYYHSDYEWKYWAFTLASFPAFYFVWTPFIAPICHPFFIIMIILFIVNPNYTYAPEF